jgi:DNA-binding PucR family transcriptional regulator
VVLLPGSDPEEAAALVCDRLGHQLRVPVTCGADGPVALLGDLASCHDRARRTLQVLLGLGRQGGASAASRLGVYTLLFGDTGESRLRRFVDHRLAALVRYDAEHRTDLVATLNAYLTAGRRHTATAQQMHIHVNTLYQRLQRISELAGIDFEDADDVLEVHLALRLHQLTQHV